MDAAHDLPDLVRFAQLIIGRAQRVVEYLDARGPAFGLHECLHFRVVNCAYFVLVEEIDDFGVVSNKTKPVALKHEISGIDPAIAQQDAARLRRTAADPLVAPAGGADHGYRHRLRVDKIAEGRRDRLRGGHLLGNLNHRNSFTLARR